MKIDALLTCAVINMGISAVFFSLYAVLRRQPINATVYFGRRLEVLREKRYHGICSEPLVPSSSWIVKAWETSEDELLNIGGLDAVVFCRVLVFSLQIFSIAAVVCVLFVLPVNYNGNESMQRWVSSRSMELFTIAHIPEGSQWLWIHCLALYMITCPACLLLYFNYKSITTMRLNHIIGSPPNPSHFAILVRSIPWSPQHTYSESVTKFFTKYHASGYLSHQMVYKCGTVERIMSDAEKVWKSCSERKWNPSLMHCGLCGSKRHSFRMLSEQLDSVVSPTTDSSDTTIATRDTECAAAFVFFKTRFDAVVASKLLQSTHPMLWVTELAPEPHDVYWSHLCIPYHQLWLRRIATVLATVVFVFAFLAPITFIQGLTQVEHLQRVSPTLRRALKSNLMNELITGYLPSVILIFFLWTVPPAMMISSAAEGCVSRSGRKMSACQKVLYFTIWNVYFVNVLSGSVINSVVEDGPKEIFGKIAKAVPMQASFFMALSLTSGWASLSWEIMQFFPLVCNWFRRFILKYDENASYRRVAFPYQTEFPKVLLFGLIGFTCSIMAPLILPFMLVYYFLSYLVYKNQFINVYSTKYESGGRYWPIAYNTTIFSLVLTQVTAIGFFGLRQCPYEASFTIPLVIGTLLFYMYCRRRFKPIFNCNTAIEVLVEMDMRDEQCGRLRKIYEELHAAYCQFTCQDSCGSELSFVAHEDEDESIYSSESSNRGRKPDEDDAWSTCGDVGVERDLITYSGIWVKKEALKLKKQSPWLGNGMKFHRAL